MKNKKISKKILSIILAVLLVVTSVQVPMFAFATGGEDVTTIVTKADASTVNLDQDKNKITIDGALTESEYYTTTDGVVLPVKLALDDYAEAATAFEYTIDGNTEVISTINTAPDNEKFDSDVVIDVPIEKIADINIDIKWSFATEADLSESLVLDLEADDFEAGLKVDVTYQSYSGTYTYLKGTSYGTLEMPTVPADTYYDTAWEVSDTDIVAAGEVKVVYTTKAATISTEAELLGGTPDGLTLPSVSLTDETFDQQTPGKDTAYTTGAVVGGKMSFKVSIANPEFKIRSVVVGNTTYMPDSDGKFKDVEIPTADTTVKVVLLFNTANLEITSDNAKHYYGIAEEFYVKGYKNISFTWSNGVKGETASYVVNDPADAKLTASYKYNQDYKAVVKTTIAFESAPFEIVSENSATITRDGDEINIVDTGATITSSTPVVIEDSTSTAVADTNDDPAIYEYVLTEGVYTLTGSDFTKITIDKTAPTFALDMGTTTVANLEDGESKDAYDAFVAAGNAVTFTADDAVVGTDKVTVNGTEITDVAGVYTYDVTANGTLTIVMTDAFGNESTQTINVACMDETAPALTINAATATALTAATNTTPQEIAIDVDEKQSGFDAAGVSIKLGTTDIAATAVTDTAVKFDASENGDYKVVVTDKESNASTELTVTVDNIDTQAPSATLNLPNDTEKGFLAVLKRVFKIADKNGDKVDVTLSVADVATTGENAALAQVDTAYYALYQAATEADFANIDTPAEIKAVMATDKTAFTDTTTVEIANPGLTYVLVWATDLAGNELVAASNGFVFDTQAPTVVLDVNGTEVATSQTTAEKLNALALELKVKDAPVSGEFVSGIASVTLEIEGETGTYSVDSVTSDFTGKTGDLSFTLDIDAIDTAFPAVDMYDYSEHKLVFKATDMSGNVTELKYAYQYDDVAPDISSALTIDTTDWTEAPQITFDATDACEIDSVKYAIVDDTTTLADLDTIFASVSPLAIESAGTYTIAQTDIIDDEYTIYVAVEAIDATGNKSQSILNIDVKKDSVTPVFSTFEILTNHTNPLDKVINKLTFGLFCKESITVRAKATDVGSGLADNATFTYKANGVDQTKTLTVDSTKSYYDITLPTGADGITYSDFSIEIKDVFGATLTDSDPAYANHVITTAQAAANTSVISNPVDDTELDNMKALLETNGIMLEADAAVINDATIGGTGLVTKEPKGESDPRYSKELELTYAITDVVSTIDNCAGINGVKITVNGVVVVDSAYTDAKVGEINYTYIPEQGSIVADVDDTNGDNTYTVPVAAANDKAEYTVQIDVIDNALNESTKTETFYVDSLDPEVKVSTELAQDYTNGSVIYTIDLAGETGFAVTNADDSVTYGELAIEYTYNDQAQEAITLASTDINKPNASYNIGTNKITVVFPNGTNGSYKIDSISVTDVYKNNTTITSVGDVITGTDGVDARNSFTIDTVLPTINNVVISKIDNLFDGFRVPGAVFTKNAAKVTVTFDNGEATLDSMYKAPFTASDIELKLTTDVIPNVTFNEVAENGNVKQYVATYIVPCNSEGMLNIAWGDVAGNVQAALAMQKSVMDIKCGDADVEYNFFLSEDVAPTIDMPQTYSDVMAANTANTRLTHTTVDGKEWYNDDVIIPITVTDNKGVSTKPVSGLYNVTITVNGEVAPATTTYADCGTPVFTTDINTADFTANADGSYKIDVTAVDYATNDAVTKSITVYKDIQAPSVSFKFANNNNVKLVKYDDVKTPYVYYFDKTTVVTVSAEDRNYVDGKVGLKSLNFVAYDINKGEVINEIVPMTGDTSSYGFTVPADFKGSIYAYATDMLGNIYENDLIDAANDDEDKNATKYPAETGKKHSTPEGAIFETKAHHDAEVGHVIIEKQTESEYVDAAGYELFNGSVNVKVTITDLYAGIQSGDINITSDENEKNEANAYPFELKNTGYKVGDVVDGWTIESMDKNLVTKITRTIKIDRNSNNIKVTAKMADRAGNESSAEIAQFSIDIVNPAITVVYNNNNADEKKYFKADRTATITIKERNFDPARVVVKATRNGADTSAKVFAGLSWNEKTYTENTNKEGTEYVATIKYTSDADYTFDIECTDRAANADVSPEKYAGQVAPKVFTIDKTAPVVKVTYECAAKPVNTNYYSKTRTATITVTEHNWDPSRFVLTYQENDAKKAKQLSWKNSGDVHTATIVCDSKTGLKYTIDYDDTDKAGNKATFIQNEKKVADYKPDEFFVDQTLTTIQFTGAIEGSHNNGSIESGVTLTDTYFDYVNVIVTGRKNGVVSNQNYKSTKVDITSFIETTRGVDDFYTISVVAYDKAGNSNASNPAIRTFSVNRNGSMFVLESYAAKLNDGTTSKVEKSVIITEYNVDQHNGAPKVELSQDGKIKKLQANKDYSVSANEADYWVYTYTIKAEVFESDAAYKILISTKDEAGNKSSNAKVEAAGQGYVASGSVKDAKAPVFAFIKDSTKPSIDINLDMSKKNNALYSIRQDSYTVTFTPTDLGAGIDPASVMAACTVGGEESMIELTQNEDGSYSFVLEGTYENLSISFKDNAGNEFEELVFNKIAVSSNVLVLFFNNTPLFIGTIIAIVAIAIGIIILIAKKKKKDDDEEAEAQA